MINLILGIIIGAVVTAFIFSISDRTREKVVGSDPVPEGREDIIAKGERGKAENLTRLRVYLEGKDQITNAEVEELLDFSDATATRYLDALEDEGLVEQKDAGRRTYYEIR
jgi:DNA-binding transcriptional ArsR family regulator